jgi:hypothetical protein
MNKLSGWPSFAINPLSLGANGPTAFRVPDIGLGNPTLLRGWNFGVNRLDGKTVTSAEISDGATI